jgi:hypothetical protein
MHNSWLYKFTVAYTVHVYTGNIYIYITTMVWDLIFDPWPEYWWRFPTLKPTELLIVTPGDDK